MLKMLILITIQGIIVILIKPHLVPPTIINSNDKQTNNTNDKDDNVTSSKSTKSRSKYNRDGIKINVKSNDESLTLAYGHSHRCKVLDSNLSKNSTSISIGCECNV